MAELKTRSKSLCSRPMEHGQYLQTTPESVRVQRQLDRMYELNKVGFLAVRGYMDNEDEI